MYRQDIEGSRIGDLRALMEEKPAVLAFAVLALALGLGGKRRDAYWVWGQS